MKMAHMNEPTRLGVNVDHVATVRQARGTKYPDPVAAAIVAELAGADQITIHLREDRRHVQERDVRILRELVTTRLNLEMAMTDEMLGIALDVQPDMVTLVPEKREERTTEGGLDCTRNPDRLGEFVDEMSDAGIVVSMFIDPNEKQLDASKELGAPLVELHTGDYAEADTSEETNAELDRLRKAARYGASLDLTVAAGHGLDYKNVQAVAAIPEIEELNIGHSIVARAIMVGFDSAVREMLRAIERAEP
jgi:pyridoxine 5-phosphate synthase